ncbi:MAG: AAA family ATPase [Verrucomicrobia bacterium]|nr:AAA family ATPase [Verrucomicrobiota bacterium]
MIASVAFRNFKALRSARIELGPFNLVIGPNGSGKTSLIQALLQLRGLARLPLREPVAEAERLPESAEITFGFHAPYDGLEAQLACAGEAQCDLLQVLPLPRGEGRDDWAGLRARLLTIRTYLFDAAAIAQAVYPVTSGELAANGANLAARLAGLQARAPVAYAGLQSELLSLFPEYAALELQPATGSFALRLADPEEPVLVPADELSQGTLTTLALLALAHDPAPPAFVCIEELDRGLHPRLLRGVRDVLYRLSFPADYGHDRPPTQVIVTTHSPHLLDLFRDHPEEVIIADKVGRAATFMRLSDRADLVDLLAEGGSLGDLWYSGILGGVPEAS